MTIFGVDVSSHKGTVDWAKVAAAGYKFAINRAILDTRPDTTWPANNRGAKAAGLIPGAYAFLYPSTSVPAAAQCDAFLKVIGNPAGLLIALDVESDGAGAYQPTFADVKAWVARFRHFWPNHPLLIYTGAWYWNSPSHPIHNADASSLGLLWDSRYVPVTYPKTAAHLYAAVPASWWNANLGGWDRVTVLQFTSSAAVPGVSGGCDVSAFLGTIAQLRALTDSVAVPAPAPSPEVDMPGIHLAPRGTEDATPLDAFLKAKVKGAGHYVFRVFDGARVAVADGLDLGVVERAKFVAPLPGWANGDPDCVVFNYGNDGQHVAVIRDIAPGVLSAPTVDCTAAVIAAKAPLQQTIDSQAATIVGLHNDVTNAARNERDRLAEVEAARIRSS